MAQNGHANVADGEDIEAMHEENKRRLAQDEFPEPGDEKTAADVQQYVVPEDNLVWQAAMQALRPYQQRGICELVHHFRTAGDITAVIQHHMGLGKTVLGTAAACLCRTLLGRTGQGSRAPKVLWLTPSRSLRNQTIERLRRDLLQGSFGARNANQAVMGWAPDSSAGGGLSVPTLAQAKQADVVVACWQRVINEARRAHEGGLAEDVQVFETLLREAADQFDFIIVDEAQSTPSNSYQKIFKHFVNAKRLYLTATVVLEPVRLQARQRPLRVLQVLSEAWALRQVNPVLAKKSVLIELHFDSIKFSNGVDLTTREDLERYMVDPAYKQAVTDNSKVQMEIVECVYKYLLEMRAFSGTPYFALLKAANREHAKDLLLASQELKTRGNNSGPPRVELYLGEECNRADVEDKMRKGDVDLVIYCQMLTVGYDNALIAAVAPCYPMGSALESNQMTGRPGRPVRPDLKYENHATGDDFDLVGSLRIPQPTLTEAELLPENKCAVIVPEPFLFRNMWENKGLHPFERDVPPPTSGAGSKRPRQEQAGSNSHSSTEKDLEASLVSTPVYEYQASRGMQVDAADRLADDDYNQATRAAKSGVFYPARALNRVTEGRHNRQNSLQRSIERLHARLGEGLPNT